jgi:hypothetical protein
VYNGERRSQEGSMTNISEGRKASSSTWCRVIAAILKKIWLSI